MIHINTDKIDLDNLSEYLFKVILESEDRSATAKEVVYTIHHIGEEGIGITEDEKLEFIDEISGLIDKYLRDVDKDIPEIQKILQSREE